MSDFRRFRILSASITDTKIGPLTGAEERPADPFAWSMYGWMLQLIGQFDEAREWLTRAREQAAKQLAANKAVASHVLPELQRLEQLLCRSL